MPEIYACEDAEESEDEYGRHSGNGSCKFVIEDV
jgi:hypothetical protein